MYLYVLILVPIQWPNGEIVMMVYRLTLTERTGFLSKGFQDV